MSPEFTVRELTLGNAMQIIAITPCKFAATNSLARDIIICFEWSLC
jgi:hypothetical protein